MNININEGLMWFGFWIFMSVFVAVDHWIYSKGYDSFFLVHKTDIEKELQQLKVEELKLKIKLHRIEGS